MKKTLVIFLAIILSFEMFGQNSADSINKIYSLEPVLFEEKIEDEYYSIQNYFSKNKSKYKWKQYHLGIGGQNRWWY